MGRGGGWYRAPGSKLGDTMNSLNKQIDFWHSKNFKLLSRIYGNAIISCDFFREPVLSVRGGHCVVD